MSPEDPSAPLRTLLVRVIGGPQIELGRLLSCEMTIVVFRGVSLILLV